MSDMPRARDLLWLTTTASCMLAGGPDDASPGGGSTPTAHVAPIGAEQEVAARAVRAQLWPQLRGTPYAAPDEARITATDALFHAAATHALGLGGTERLPELAHTAGFVVERWRIGGHHYLALLEGPAIRGSAGSFVLRVGPSEGPERLLQAPHAFHDLGTGELALEIFLADPTGFRGLFTNTLHRYVQDDGHKRKQDGENNPADVCHNEAHAFVAATMGVVRAVGAMEVVQLHGYADDHVLPDRPDAQAVVSTGAQEDATGRVAAVAAALQQSFGVTVVRYPEDVNDLGGKTNVIGRRVRKEPNVGFLHIELSSTFRQELRRRNDAPTRFAAALRAEGTRAEIGEVP